MFTPFGKLPGHARVWVYQASEPIDPGVTEAIGLEMEQFLESWTSHQAGVLASFQLLHGIFLVIGVDEDVNSTGGCSIDAKVRFIRHLESEFGISFFDRHRIAFRIGEDVLTESFGNFALMLTQGKVDDRTLVFNNLVSTVRELNENWQVPFVHSWQRNLMPV